MIFPFFHILVKNVVVIANSPKTKIIEVEEEE